MGRPMSESFALLEELRPSLADEVVRLAALSPLEYDRARKAEAERLGVRVSVLDEEVRRARPEADSGGSRAQGRAVSIPDAEPWPDAVNGASVLTEAASMLRAHAALPAGADVALALWAAHTHAFDAFAVTPRLVITSPEKRCGKTTALRLVSSLSARAVDSANISVAALFRFIEISRPTLFIDEADTFLAEKQELRGVLNAGFLPNGQVIRTVGDDHEPRAFAVFAPVAIAAIGRLPDTIMDRSVIVSMRRRHAGERIARLRAGADPGEAIRRKLARLAHDRAGAWRAADPPTPDGLNDRGGDVWRVLLAIADDAGEDWPHRARAACVALTGADEGEQDTTRTRLLADIRAILAAKGGPQRIASKEVAELLAEDESGPWAAFGRFDKPLTPVALARLLKPFRITPKTLRNGAATWKGYASCDFADAFNRYLPPAETETPVPSVTPSQPLRANGFSEVQTRNGALRVTLEETPETLVGHGPLRCDGSERVFPGDGGDL
jgi:putative DNA primase/helicase